MWVILMTIADYNLKCHQFHSFGSASIRISPFVFQAIRFWRGILIGSTPMTAWNFQRKIFDIS